MALSCLRTNRLHASMTGIHGSVRSMSTSRTPHICQYSRFRRNGNNPIHVAYRSFHHHPFVHSSPWTRQLTHHYQHQFSFFSSKADPSSTDYYQVLGVDTQSSTDDIKRAYRKLALEHHPDRNQNDRKNAEDRFKNISAAYQVLFYFPEISLIISAHPQLLGAI